MSSEAPLGVVGSGGRDRLGREDGDLRILRQHHAEHLLEGEEVVTASRLDAPGFVVNRLWMKAVLERIVAEGETAVQAAIEREAVRTGRTIRVETLLDYGWQY